MVLGVVSHWIGSVISFHDALHGLRTGQGAGSSSLEAKLLQKLTVMIEEVIYNFFLDLQKAYENLYRERCLEILVGYGIGPRKERILRIYLEHLLMVAKAGCYYGTALKGY